MKAAPWAEALSKRIGRPVELGDVTLHPSTFAPQRTVFVEGREVGNIPIEQAEDMRFVGFTEEAIFDYFATRVLSRLGEKPPQRPWLRYPSELTHQILMQNLRLRLAEQKLSQEDKELALETVEQFKMWLGDLPAIVLGMAGPQSMLFIDTDDGILMRAVSAQFTIFDPEVSDPTPDRLARSLYEYFLRELEAAKTTGEGRLYLCLYVLMHPRKSPIKGHRWWNLRWGLYHHID